MPDTITATGSTAKFLPHPEGQFVAQCVDTIALGDVVSTYPGRPDQLVSKCALVFRTGERNADTGEYIDIGREFTVSMGDKANLRKFLEQWRGKAYTDEQVEAGVPLHKLAGNFGLITVEHQRSQAGRTYGKVTACVGLPKQMQELAKPFADYSRSPHWDEKKRANAAAAAAFREAQPAQGGVDDEPPHEDDDLPF